MAKKPRKPKQGGVTDKRVRQTEDAPPPSTFKAHAEPEGDEPWDSDGLTVRQRRFVDALIGPAGGNATKAARMAGYAAENYLSLSATASENLGKPNVQRAIAHALAAQRLTPEWAKRQLADRASASMANFVKVDADGRATLDFGKAAAAGALGQIKEIKEEVLETPSGGVVVLKRTIKVHDSAPALALLLKYHGLVDGDGAETGEREIWVRKVDRRKRASDTDAE